MTAAGGKKNRTKVVVFHQGALGDFLAAASVIDGLCRSYPNLHIDFWSKPQHVALLAGKRYLGECFSLDGPLIPSLLQDALWETINLPSFLLRSDQVFVLGQPGTRILSSRLSSRLCGRVDWVQSFPAAKETGMHVCDFIEMQMHDLGWRSDKAAAFSLVPAANEIEAARELLREHGITSAPILIHPGSGGRGKVWPLKNWHGLLGRLRSELPVPALLSVGPADGYLDDFANAMREAGLPVIRGLSLVRLAALLSCCKLYIGSDSGVSHLAAATGIPTVAVFGPTDPAVWAPRGRDVHFLQRSWSPQELLEWRASDSPPPADDEITQIISVLTV